MDGLDTFESDNAIYIPVAGISRIRTAPYTPALIHFCLEKFTHPEMLPVVIHTFMP